ncbi:MAG: OmpA family protein [Candidatus Hydrogenedentes bacterium]|nr:OmpA family protein [Candidatus Hydrogenedentota bacterium]
MRRNFNWLSTVLIAGLTLAGCHSLGDKFVIPATVTAPAEGEHVGLQEVMVVVDASGSMWPGSSFAYAKALTESMVKAFPDGHYGAGLLSFGGEWQFEWIDYPVRPLDRDSLEGAASDMRFLAGSPPLEDALSHVDAQSLRRTRARALIIVSDGKADRDAVLARCVELAHGPAPLCIHTVQVGDDAEGGRLLADMANLTPCGSYRHGDAIATDTGMDEFIREVFFQDLAVLEMIDGAGGKTILGKVLFASDSAVVTDEYNALLDKVAETLKTTADVFLCVDGHTDSTASNRYNKALSQRRAEAVCKALIARGASTDRVFPMAYGEENPTGPNNNRAARQQNRRVELTVID